MALGESRYGAEARSNDGWTLGTRASALGTQRMSNLMRGGHLKNAQPGLWVARACAE